MPLGNLANKVTPPSATSGGDYSPAALRAMKYRLRNTAGRLLPRQSLPGADGVVREIAHRVGRCGHQLVGTSAALVLGEGGARILGVETCGSVWLCPVCSARIAEHRRSEIEKMLTGHVQGRRMRLVPSDDVFAPAEWEAYQAPPGAVLMATLTVPHRSWDNLARLRADVAECWTRTVRGAPWDRWRARAGIVGVIRSMEVTHGRNGWHPHLHVLILAGDISADLLDDFRVWLAERWRKFVAATGLGETNGHGVDVYRASRVEDAGDYVAKWGCDSELTKWHVKGARGRNRSPWELLAAAADGDAEARMRWREFAAVFAGTRHITMSHGLRALYLSGVELSDAEICAVDHGLDPAEVVTMTGETIIGRFRRQVWIRLVTAGVLTDVLEAAESGGWAAVRRLMVERGLSIGKIEWPKEKS